MELKTERNKCEESVRQMQRELAATRNQEAEALRTVRSLEKEQGDLQEELAASRQKRKKSFSALEEISQKLDNAGTSWRPWDQINGIKDHLQESLASEDAELLQGA